MAVLKASGEATIRIGAAFIVAATLAVALRLITKLRTKVPLLPEDCFSILALPLFYCYEAVLMRSVLVQSGGHSLDPTQLTLNQLDVFLKHLYAAEMLFVATITAVKLSILLLYRTIFVTPSFRRITSVVGILCLLWFTAMLLATIFQCHPIKAAWNQLLVIEGSGHCLKSGTYIFGYELSNVFIDVCILCLPIYMIRRLQLPLRRKITVSSIFLLGGFVCITSVVRMIYVFNPKTGEPRSLPNVMNWSTIELGSAIICACLPTYGPFVGMAGQFLAKTWTWCSSKLSTLRASRNTGSRSLLPTSWRSHEGPFEELADANSAKAESNRNTCNEVADSKKSSSYPLETLAPQRATECI